MVRQRVSDGGYSLMGPFSPLQCYKAEEAGRTTTTY